jgi:hypothetical protein
MQVYLPSPPPPPPPPPPPSELKLKLTAQHRLSVSAYICIDSLSSVSFSPRPRAQRQEGRGRSSEGAGPGPGPESGTQPVLCAELLPCGLWIESAVPKTQAQHGPAPLRPRLLFATHYAITPRCCVYVLCSLVYSKWPRCTAHSNWQVQAAISSSDN